MEEQEGMQGAAMITLPYFKEIDPKCDDTHCSSMIDLRALHKYYRSAAGDYHALRGIDLQINHGEFVSIIGKSGSGKSTLLNMITGIDRPTSGEVLPGRGATRISVRDSLAYA
jgi:ABC-type nitrate/sulfonate/bicarbonate transport system ATPase subunit